MGCRNSKTFSEILKFNPYHDSKGRFATAGGATSFTYRPGASRAHDLAIEREKQRHAEGNSSTAPRKYKPVPREETPRVKAINGIENKIRNQNFESAAVIDDEGKQLFFKDGQRSQVGFTRLECMQMANNTLTHNHPRCSMFSTEDLKCMTYNNMYEIRATNRDGVTYSIRRADGGYSTNKAMKFVDAYEAEYPKSTKFAQKDLDSRGFQDKIWRGEISVDEANIEFGRSTAKYMAEFAEREAPKYGLVFTVEHASTSAMKSLRNLIMKSDAKDDYLVLDRETNGLEDKAFNEWLEKAKKHKPGQNTAKSFKDVYAERSES